MVVFWEGVLGMGGVLDEIGLRNFSISTGVQQHLDVGT
jgi:hypothetical protein